jgi:hypothetical protein
MAWIVSNKDEQEFVRKLSRLSAREAGILAATIIDDRLKGVIKARRHGIKHKLVDTFNKRINFGFDSGLYGQDMCEDLHAVREIRNGFAHELPLKSFRTKGIVELVKGLKLAEKFPIKCDGSLMGDSPGATAFQRAASFLGVTQFKRLNVPRTRFMRCAETLVVCLSVVLSDPYNKTNYPEF